MFPSGRSGRSGLRCVLPCPDGASPTDRAKATGHSTAEDAANIAKLAKVDRLILGHFSSRYKGTAPLLNEAKAVFENVICVEDGDVYLVK